MNGTKGRTARAGQHQHQNRRMRRKKIAPPKGHPTDAELISAYLANNEVTKCPAGWAIGSLPHSCHGLD